MALDFPSSPVLNQVFTSGNRSWIWNGTEWIGNTPIINYTANRVLLGNGTSLFQEVAPGTAGNLLTSNGTTWTSATAPAGGITNVVTATGNTTLTSTPTILRITPTGYGTTVKLPDATTMTVGTGKFDVQNLSAFSVRIADTSGTLLGFAGAFSTVNIGLASNSTANGSWTLANAARLGVSAERLNSTSESTTAVSSQTPIIQLDDNRVFLLLRTGAGLSYGQVYDQATNTFGAETLIRNANVFSTAGAQKIDANTVLVASINGTALQAVVLSISGTTITVNSPASATISNSISAFQFLRAIPAGGFVMGWLDTASSFRIVGISVSGTTPSIGTEVGVFNSQSGNLFAQTVTNRIILFAPNDNSNQGGFIAYSLSGNTLTAGTRVATPNASSAGSYFIKLTETTFFFDCSLLSMTDVRVGVLQINAGLGLTVYSSSAISSSTGVFNAYSVSSTKVFFTLGSTVYWNLMTFTGSAITLGTALLAAPATTSTSISGVYNNRLYVVGSTNILWRIDFSGSSLVVEGPALGSITTSIYANDVSYDGRLAGLFVSDLLVSAITAPSSVQSANAFVSALQIPKIGIDGVNFAASGLKKPAGNDRFCFEYTNQNSRYWVRKIELV